MYYKLGKLPKAFFVFDVESMGLYGQPFAVAGGVYEKTGKRLYEFAFHIKGWYEPGIIEGTSEDRKWVTENVTIPDSSIGFDYFEDLHQAFWEEWIKARDEHGAEMACECLFPVESGFLRDVCEILATLETSPYPVHEIASFMGSSGLDYRGTQERLESELPAHNPLMDSRQSARLLFESLNLKKPFGSDLKDL